MHPRKVAFMPRTGQVMVKKLKVAQDPVAVEREQALVQRTPEKRAERLAKARARVELFNVNQGAVKPRVDAGASSATAAAVGAVKPRVELVSAAASAVKPRAELFGATNTQASSSARVAPKPRAELFGGNNNGVPRIVRGTKAAEEA